MTSPYYVPHTPAVPNSKRQVETLRNLNIIPQQRNVSPTASNFYSNNDQASSAFQSSASRNVSPLSPPYQHPIEYGRPSATFIPETQQQQNQIPETPTAKPQSRQCSPQARANGRMTKHPTYASLGDVPHTGAKIEALYENGRWYPAVVRSMDSSHTWGYVVWEDNKRSTPGSPEIKKLKEMRPVPQDKSDPPTPVAIVPTNNPPLSIPMTPAATKALPPSYSPPKTPAFTIAPPLNTRCWAKSPRRFKWYPATVIGNDQGAMCVQFDFGEVDYVTMKDIRQYEGGSSGGSGGGSMLQDVTNGTKSPQRAKSKRGRDEEDSSLASTTKPNSSSIITVTPTVGAIGPAAPSTTTTTNFEVGNYYYVTDMKTKFEKLAKLKAVDAVNQTVKVQFADMNLFVVARPCLRLPYVRVDSDAPVVEVPMSTVSLDMRPIVIPKSQLATTYFLHDSPDR